jgi:hypothetical protein
MPALIRDGKGAGWAEAPGILCFFASGHPARQSGARNFCLACFRAIG